MKKGKKTIEVQVVKDMVNKQLAGAAITEPERYELCNFIEKILHMTDNYKGFDYVDWINGGWERWKSDQDASETPVNNRTYLGSEYKRKYL